MDPKKADVCISPSEAAHSIEKYAHWFHVLVSYMMSPDDMISFSKAKKIVTSDYMSYWRWCFSSMALDSQIRIFQTMVNIVSTLYIYLFASWTMYIFTTVSGIKKLQTTFLKQPGYIIPFFIAFYFRFLTDQDLDFIEKIEDSLGISGSYKTIWSSLKSGNKTLVVESIYPTVHTITKKFNISDPGVEVIDQIADQLMKISLTLSASKIDSTNLFPVIDKLKGTYKIKKDEDPACYIKERDQIDYDDSAIVEFYERVSKEGYLKQIKRQIKKDISGSNKRVIKLELEKRLEMKDEHGKVMCLSECKKRHKARTTWCKDGCGRTIAGMGKPWCNVESNLSADKQSWENCDPEKISEEELCFTGFRYKTCKKK